eukprot:3267638-Prymnesium_polylepis.1
MEAGACTRHTARDRLAPRARRSARADTRTHAAGPAGTVVHRRPGHWLPQRRDGRDADSSK